MTELGPVTRYMKAEARLDELTAEFHKLREDNARLVTDLIATRREAHDLRQRLRPPPPQAGSVVTCRRSTRATDAANAAITASRAASVASFAVGIT